MVFVSGTTPSAVAYPVTGVMRFVLAVEGTMYPFSTCELAKPNGVRMRWTVCTAAAVERTAMF
eukprot:1876003-Prorocentrum_lima.AAC.1